LASDASTLIQHNKKNKSKKAKLKNEIVKKIKEKESVE